MKTSTTVFISLVAILHCSSPQKVADKPVAAETHSAELKTADVEYQQDNKPYEGYAAYLPEKAKTQKLPAVLVIHEWTGLGEFAKMRADMLAQEGYYAFAMDMYGKGIRAKDHVEAGKLSGAYGKNRKLLRSRMKTALEFLKKQPEVDVTKISVVGYCFGGMSALELGLMGEDVKGIVAVHAIFKLPTLSKEAKNIKGKVLIHHGEADTFVSPAEIKTLKTALSKNKIPFEFVSHKGAKHAFSNKFNKGHEKHGIEYNEEADKKSWESILQFLKTL